MWNCSYARKEEKRGRAKGGLIIGVRKKSIKRSIIVEKEKERIILSRLKMGKEWLKVISVYGHTRRQKYRGKNK